MISPLLPMWHWEKTKWKTYKTTYFMQAADVTWWTVEGKRQRPVWKGIKVEVWRWRECKGRRHGEVKYMDTGVMSHTNIDWPLLVERRTAGVTADPWGSGLCNLAVERRHPISVMALCQRFFFCFVFEVNGGQLWPNWRQLSFLSLNNSMDREWGLPYTHINAQRHTGTHTEHIVRPYRAYSLAGYMD